MFSFIPAYPLFSSMGATQLWIDFSELTSSSPKSNHSQIIPFPVPPQKTGQAFLSLDFAFASYGAWISYGKRLSSSERSRKNNEAISLLSKPQDQLSPSDLDILRSYSGWGGLSASDERGVLYDYYTSPLSRALYGVFFTSSSQSRRTR
jgi:hypothetical protein